MIGRLVGLAALMATLAAGPTQARELVFTTALSGGFAPTMKDSKATGRARLVVDTDRQTVGLTLEVTGVTLDQLWDRLVAAPIGPIHLHAYGHNHGDPNDTTLALGLPYGSAYSATPTGFRVVVDGLDYAKGAAVVDSKTSFDAFVAALQGGGIVLNIHTDRANDGEIAGPFEPA